MIYAIIYIVVGVITLLLIINSNDENKATGVLLAGMTVATMISGIFYILS